MQPSNRWNLCASCVRSMRTTISMRMPNTAEDGSRELVSLLAAIGVDDTALPPALIFKESSGDIRSSLMQHLDDKKQQGYFGASENGWSSDAFARTWLTHVFHEHTKSKAGRKKRLLILDGHGSHQYCLRIPGIGLQPLDVGIFSPLGKAYSRRLDELIQSTHNFFFVKKSNFWPLMLLRNINPISRQILSQELKWTKHKGKSPGSPVTKY
ncbi:hypothetical protein VTN49DRAFT_6149 [Thermomyces lanuginosus]|uniref:uncharacterized protein n=1 Tax=Thermomyces lanuginosus TaxID=5541 RepID=UPI00374435AA